MAYHEKMGEMSVFGKNTDIFGSYIIVDYVEPDGRLHGYNNKIYCSSAYYETVEIDDTVKISYRYNSSLKLGVLYEH